MNSTDSRRRRRIVLVPLFLALAGMSTVAAAYAGGPGAAAPTPGVTPTPHGSPTPPPTATQPGQPPIIINLPPSGGGAPQPTPDTSAPLLVVTGYQSAPNPVQSGQPFTLTVTVTNTGSKYANAIHASVADNSSFVGISAPASLGQLDPNQSATFSLAVQTAILAGGAYPLSVQFTYRVGESGEQGVTRSVGIQVAGGSGVRGDPKVVVRSAILLTQPSTIGAAFDVQLVLQNTGPRKAYGVGTTLATNDNLSPAQGSGSASAGDLAPGQPVTLTLSLVLTKASPTGRVSQTLKLAYRDANNTAFTSDETASLDLGFSASQEPQLVVTSQAVAPDTPGPGDTFTLTLQIRNVGTDSARRVLARLGDANSLKPFVPLGTSNVGFADQIAPGATATFSTTLLMDGASPGGAFTIPVVLAYDDALSQAQSETEVVGLLALSRPQLQIDLTKGLPDSLAPGQSFDLPLEVINIGRQRLDVSTVEVQSDDLALTKNSLYVGPLDPSISGTLTAKAVAQHAGPATFKVIVHYRDELNRMQTVTQPFSVQIAAGPSPTPPASASPGAQGPSGGLVALLLRLVGLGG